MVCKAGLVAGHAGDNAADGFIVGAGAGIAVEIGTGVGPVAFEWRRHLPGSVTVSLVECLVHVALLVVQLQLVLGGWELAFWLLVGLEMVLVMLVGYHQGDQWQVLKVLMACWEADLKGSSSPVLAWSTCGLGLHARSWMVLFWLG